MITLRKDGDAFETQCIAELVRWKNSAERKPMVLKGARQVGKTWLMKEFGENYYDSFVYLTLMKKRN